MKTCNKCGVPKELSEFSPTSTYKGQVQYRGDCKKCNAENAQRRRDNPEERKRQVIASRAWKQKNPEKVRDWKYRDSYGIGFLEFTRMSQAQDGKCIICERPRKLCVDHCHKTGKVRGLICHICNGFLGTIDDSVERLQKAIEYLRKT